MSVFKVCAVQIPMHDQTSKNFIVKKSPILGKMIPVSNTRLLGGEAREQSDFEDLVEEPNVQGFRFKPSTQLPVECF